MKKLLLVVFLIPFIFSCSSDDSSTPPVEIEETDNEEPFSSRIKTITQSMKPIIDSLFYENDQLKTHKHYENNELDYKIGFTYNSNNQLIRRINEGFIDIVYTSIFDFEYDNTGNLVKRYYTNDGVTKTTTYIYSPGLVEIHQHEALFYKLNLENNNVVSIEEKDINSGEYKIEWLLEYDNLDRLNKLSKRLSGSQYFIVYFPTYDDMENPFHDFEFKLPNNLSINLLENPDYSGIYGGLFLQDFYRYIGYFHKNNLIKTNVESGGHISFVYSYNSQNYPTAIVKESDPDRNTYIIGY